MLGITRYLCRRHKEASQQLTSSERCFEQLCRAADPQTAQHWKHEIEHAEAMRLAQPKVMDIYGAKESDANANLGPSASAPSQEGLAIEVWLEFGLVIEEKQCVFNCNFAFLC